MNDLIELENSHVFVCHVELPELEKKCKENWNIYRLSLSWILFSHHVHNDSLKWLEILYLDIQFRL